LAHVDPRFQLHAAPAPKPERFSLKIHEVSPEDITPNGDRYVVEVIDIDEAVQLGQLLVITQQKPDKPGDPMADPTVENRGVLAAVVVSVGNGHLLGLPDHKLKADGDEVLTSPADVPMFYEPGQVVLVDYNARGRALKILNRECRIVNQIDVLGSLPVRLRRGENGWEKAD
jgi:hypothetical protein